MAFTISGLVTDSNGNPLDGAQVYIINDDDGTMEATTTTASDGTYSASVASGTDYTVISHYESSGDYSAGTARPYITE